MPTLVKAKTGIFYIVYSQKGKRVWRSTRTRVRDQAYRIFLNAQSKPEQLTFHSLRDLQKEYLEYVRTNFSPKNVEVYEYVFKHFNRFLQKDSITDVTVRDIESYKSFRAKKLSATSVNQHIRCLRAFFGRMKTWKYINDCPTDGVRDIRVVESIPLYLTQDALATLLDYTKGTELHEIILFAVMTGMRRGEILHLTWAEIDFVRGTILVRSTQSYRTKAGKIRIVPMNSAVRELLERMPSKSGLLFPGDRGGIYNGDFLAKRFKDAIQACNLDPKLHFHSLRHTFASLLVQNGVSLYHVQKLLGHSSSRVTEVYAHLGNSELSSTVERLVHVNRLR